MDHEFQLGSDHILSFRLFSLPLTHKGQLSVTGKILHTLSIGKEQIAQKQCNIKTNPCVMNENLMKVVFCLSIKNNNKMLVSVGSRPF